MTDVHDLGVAITSVRAGETLALLAALVGQETRPGHVSVTYQGRADDSEDLRGRLEGLAREHAYDGLLYRAGSGRGASTGRNDALRALPDSVTWVWTPNDTSRPPVGWAGTLGRGLAGLGDDVAAVALDYAVGGRLRRQASAVPELTGWDVWRAIEASLVWRRRAVLDAGGFDEGLGTGARGWAQSGEATDLLMRLRASGHRVATLPLVVEGPAQHPGRETRVSRRKEFYYGVGFGCVARRHFPVWRSLVAVVAPLVKLLAARPVEGQRLGVRMSLAASAGRATGLVLGERAVRLRLRGRHWA